MIKTTAAYKEAIKKNRIIHHQAVINFQDGKNITIEDMDMYTFKISDASSNTNSFDLGSTIARQLALKLNNIDGRFDDHDFNEAKITAKAGLELPDGTIEWLDKGIYVAEPGEESGNTITVDAFDYMTKFDQPYSISKLVYPATLGEIVRDACSCCGVTLASDTATFDNDNFVVQRRPEDTSATFRNVLKWVGEIACKFFEINAFGKLSARWYNTELLEATWIRKKADIWLDIDGNPITDTTGQEIETVLEVLMKQGNTNVVDIDEHEEILKISTLLSGSTVQTDDVVVTGIRVNEETDENDTVYQFGTEGYLLEISGNKLIQDGSGATIAAYLGERLNGIQFRPMTINVVPDPAREAGDLGFVVDAKGRYHKTIFTNVDYTAHAAQNLISGAEAPTRLSSVRYSQATIAYKELRANMKKQKTEWNTAFDDLQDVMKTKNGLFPIRETMEDGSSILYFCDKPELSDASIVVKFSAAGWAMSTDSGKTWNSGWLVDGTMIASILNAIGINAKWINAGDITVKDAEGNIIFYVDMDTGCVNISGDAITIGGKTATKALSDNLEESKKYSDEIAAKVKNMTLLLSNDMQTISADSEGNIPKFPNVTTTATVLYGAADITNDCNFTITKSEGIIGEWNSATHTYSVTGISVDDGWVDIKATYLQNLATTKRFTISKIRSGAQGIPGVAVDGKTTYMHIMYSPVINPTADQMTTIPDKYIGTYTDFVEVNSTDPARYTWGQFRGDPGEQGAAGKDGINGKDGVNGKNGKDSYTWIKYASRPDGLDMSDSPDCVKFLDSAGNPILDSAGNQIFTITQAVYMGIAANKDTAVKSEDPADYIWPRFRGNDGYDGKDGKNGIPGEPGKDGRTQYTHLAHANSADGKVDFSVDDSNREYIGMYADFEQEDSTDPEKYKWTLVKGKDGAQGIPGPQGPDGRTPYFHVAYADSVDGKTGFSISDSTNKLYIGQYTDYTAENSTDPAKYKWAKFKGDPGVPGRTYILEPSSATIKQNANKTLKKTAIQFRSYRRDGNEAERVAYKGKLVVEQTTDDTNWSILAQTSVDNDYITVTFSKDSTFTALRCSLYESGTNVLLDRVEIPVVIDAEALTPDDILNILTNGGEYKGIYKENGQLYVMFTYAKGGSLKIGGVDNASGILQVVDEQGDVVVTLDKNGISATKGTFSGELKSATGTFTGELNGATGSFTGTVGSFGKNGYFSQLNSGAVEVGTWEDGEVTGYLSSSEFTNTGVWGMRIAGRGALFISTPYLLVGDYSEYNEHFEGSIGQSGTCKVITSITTTGSSSGLIINSLSTKTITFEKGLMVTAF